MAMALKILEIQGKGDKDSEYVKLEVIDDCYLANYVLFDTTYRTSDKVSNKQRHVYLLPYKDVKKGDTIYLYTRKGSDESTKYEYISNTHKLFWNLNQAVWNDGGDKAILIRIGDIQEYKC